jgi:hypothetical protein
MKQVYLGMVRGFPSTIKQLWVIEAYNYEDTLKPLGADSRPKIHELTHSVWVVCYL